MILKVSDFFQQVSTSLLFIQVLFIGLINHAQNLKFSHLGLDEGLTQETIHCISKDQNGFLWLGTSDGAVRYDGHDFFSPQVDVNTGLDTSGYRIGSILAHENYVYIGTSQNGLLRYNTLDESIVQIGDSDSNCTRLVEYQNKIFASFYNNGVIMINEDGSIDAKSIYDNLPQKITGISILNDILFLGTDDGTIISTTLNQKDNSGFRLDSDLFSSLDVSINNLGIFNNEVWVMTNSGIFRISKANHSVEKVDTINQFGDALNINVTTVAFQNESYYIGSASQGLMVAKFKDGKLNVEQHYQSSKKYDAATINSDGINDLMVSNDILFIGNINLDITSIESQDVFKQPTDNFNLKNPSVFAVYDTENFLFTGSSSGLVISDNQNNSDYNLLAQHDRVRGITQDDNNNIWFVSNEGVFVIPMENFNLEHPTVLKMPIDAKDHSKLPAENMRNVYKDNSGTILDYDF